MYLKLVKIYFKTLKIINLPKIIFIKLIKKYTCLLIIFYASIYTFKCIFIYHYLSVILVLIYIKKNMCKINFYIMVICYI